ncbi:MAG: IPT/TIG domain-containing protein [Planctomycetota bacterium]|nr:IPT/TIG domain-containing protein [Planctomycetota bacterium]
MRDSLLAAAICLCSSTSLLAQPVITNVEPRGLQVGAETEITLSGQNLAKGSRLLLPFPVKQETLSENGSSQLKLRVTLPESVQPGLYPLRILNENGLSSPQRIGVDRLPQRAFSAEQQVLPVALSGRLVGAQILKTSFESKKGDVVVVEVEANRIGSKLRPVLHIYDSRGKQVVFAQRSRSLKGDARCFFETPADGVYSLEMHDFVYRGASPGFFRLKVGNFDYADMALPVGIPAAGNRPLRLIKYGMESEFLTEEKQPKHGWNQATVSSPLFSGSRPQVYFSPHAEFLEVAQSATPHPAGSVPLGINGRLEKAREKDLYLVDVQPGSKLMFDLLGRRIGSPIDGKIVLRNEKGGVLAQNDDRKGEQDALLAYTVPGNVSKLVVEISDSSALGSKSHIYRLGVFDTRQPGVLGTVGQGTINMTSEGTVHVPVQLVRNNYNGPVKLEFQGLDAGYEVAGDVIPAGSDVGLLTLTAKGKAPGIFSMETVFEQDGKTYRADVFGPGSSTSGALDASRKWLAVAPMSSKKLDVQWSGLGNGQTVNLGGQLRTRVRVTRPDFLKGPVRIRLITNQKIPKKRVRKNNKDTFVDDLEKTIRAANLEVGKPTEEIAFPIEIPSEIAEKDWELLVVAELLSADRKKVLFSASTRRLIIKSKRLAAVELSEGKKITLPKNGIVEHRLAGTIQRADSSQPMRISLVGLPKGVVVEPVLTEAGKNDFSAVLKIPVNAELLKLKSLKVEFAFLDVGDATWVMARDKAQKLTISLAAEPEKKKADQKTPAK